MANTTRMLNQEAKRIAVKTADAYSRERYTDAAWGRIASRLILTYSMTPAEAEWVLESKHMRWAADHANRSHSVTDADFTNYVSSIGGIHKILRDAQKDLARTPVGADLAGACEGEQIAQMIDLLRVAASGGSIQNSASLLLAEIERRAK